MKRIATMLIIAILFSAFVSVGIIYAQCALGGKVGTGKGEIVNTTCPIMGGKIDNSTPYKAEYKGKTIGFCCGGCVSMFNKEPEKYLEKLEED